VATIASLLTTASAFATPFNPALFGSGLLVSAFLIRTAAKVYPIKSTLVSEICLTSPNSIRIHSFGGHSYLVFLHEIKQVNIIERKRMVVLAANPHYQESKLNMQNND